MFIKDILFLLNKCIKKINNGATDYLKSKYQKAKSSCLETSRIQHCF